MTGTTAVPAMLPETVPEAERPAFGQIAKGNTSRAHGWQITSDFESGNGELVEVNGPASATWSPEADPGEDYNGGAYYFCCRIANERRETRTLDVTIRAHHEPVWQGWSMALGSPLIVLPEGTDGGNPASWRQIPASQMHVSRDSIRVSLDVPGGEAVYVSNFYWYQPSRVQARLAAIAAALGKDVRPFVAGRTSQGRPIAGIRLLAAEPKRARIVLTGTTQASEGGQLPCLWALEYLLSAAPPARAARERYTFDVLPVTNPDGAALGTCMTNSLGQNPLFDARAAADGQASSAESVALWRLVAGESEQRDEPAAAYLEYHYYFQTGRPCRPYVLTPELYESGQRRATYERTSEALRALSDDNQIFVERDHARFRHSLIYVAAERLGTAAHLYKLNTILSAAESQARAIAVLDRFLGALTHQA